MLEALQSQKKETTKRKRKSLIEVREDNRKINQVYRKKNATGFNLLKKWVPGTKMLTRPDILMETVRYIKELKSELEKCTPMESTKTGMNSVQNHSARREPQMTDPSPSDLVTGLSSLMADYSDISEPNSLMVTDISEPEMADLTAMEDHSATLKSLRHKILSTPTGASDEESSRAISSPMEDHSATLKSLRHKILGTPTGASDEESSRETSSPIDDHSTVLSTSEEIPQWVIVSPEVEELPEFNSVEDLRQWLGL
jgi:hypothetical protein